MTAIFTKVIPFLILAEGDKDSDNPNDYGGESKFGISKRSYPDVDIASLTIEEASVIYERDYWKPYRIDEVIDQTIANQIFLLLINMNPEKAIRIIQTAINVCGRTITVIDVDGKMGEDTIDSLNKLDRFWLSDHIRIEECRYYLAETDRDKTQINNLRSWIRRTLL